MSKDLTPLEAFNKITSGGCKGKYHNYCEIVENALKEYEKYEDSLPLDNNDKKLKAFEVIKEKGCSYMETALIISCNNYEDEYCVEMNSGRVYSSKYECEEAFKTKAEFVLLKEALL